VFAGLLSAGVAFVFDLRGATGVREDRLNDYQQAARRCGTTRWVGEHVGNVDTGGAYWGANGALYGGRSPSTLHPVRELWWSFNHEHPEVAELLVNLFREQGIDASWSGETFDSVIVNLAAPRRPELGNEPGRMSNRDTGGRRARRGKKMTPAEALAIFAYDVSDLISRGDGYDGLIPDDKMTQDDLIAALPAFFRTLGFDPFPAGPTPAAEPRPAPEFMAHTCNNGRGPYFGRLNAGCPRCDELLAGAPARDVPARLGGRSRAAEADDARRAADIRAHNCRTARCGPVCTYGQW
jgi:hypothetical protein